MPEWPETSYIYFVQVCQRSQKYADNTRFIRSIEKPQCQQPDWKPLADAIDPNRILDNKMHSRACSVESLTITVRRSKEPRDMTKILLRA